MIIDVLSPLHRFTCHYFSPGGDRIGVSDVLIDPPGWLVFTFTGDNAEENRRMVNRNFLVDVLRFYPHMEDLEGVHEMKHSYTYLQCDDKGKPMNVPEADDRNLVYWLDEREWGSWQRL